jgi:hypothetical protein
LFANTAPKLYVGGAVCEASEKEWVTWNNGETERFFARSALAPSKKKFVRWVAEEGVQSRVARNANVNGGVKGGVAWKQRGGAGLVMQARKPQLTLDLFREVLDGSWVRETKSGPPFRESAVDVSQRRDYGGKRRGRRSRGHFGRG